MTLEMSHIYVAGWGALVVALSLSTFGLFWSFMFIVYALLFALGFLCVLGYWGYTRSVDRMSTDSNLELSDQGLDRILREVWKSSRKSYKMDKRLTGSSIIDEPLQEVLQYFFRDYVHSWYCTVSSDEEFLYDLRQTLQRALIAFANRSKDVEWVNFLTTRFVDDITNHLKIYRLAKERLDKAVKIEGEETSQNIENLFFQVESEMDGGISREKICLFEQSEKEYLCDISEMLLYLLLPPEDFHNKPFRYLFRELIASCVLLPSVKTACDPDYINQTCVWLCKDSTFTREAFLTVISEGLNSVDDVQAVKDKVNVEIAKLRAHDSETSDAADAAVRQQLSSLLFVIKLCNAKIRTLEYGEGELPSVPSENSEEPDHLFVPSQPVPILPLQVILDNNTALSYFIEFMTSVNGQVYLYFWLAVEGYRVTAEQQLSVKMERQLHSENPQKVQASPTRKVTGFGDLRGEVQSIFDQYLSEKADPRVELSKDQLKKTQKRVTQDEPSADCFDDAQLLVYDQLGQDQFYGAFLNSQAYMRCLLDLDILKEKSEDGDTVSINDEDFETRSLPDGLSGYSDINEDVAPGEKLWTSDDDLRLTAGIHQIGLCKDAGKSYAVYAISVFRATQEGTSSWTVYRRYSDFDDLHMRIKDKFGCIANLLLPAKRTFRNMDKDFLEKRRSALDAYAQIILSTEVLEKHLGLFEIVANFLEHGKYSREKGQFARKVDNLRHSVHNVSHAIKTVPLGLSGGVQKIFTNKPGGRAVKDDSKQIYADVDFEDDDNIALRVLLLLMDEIFDLKDRNLWLRRRIIVLLRQIIKTTYGDRINRKIVESVDDMTSAEQIGEYVKMFRDSFWPGGILSEPRKGREADVKLRTRVAGRTKMFGSIPEELSRFLGTDVTMDGVCRVFDTFQYSSLNKRIMYVLAEGMLEQLFPDNKFAEIFRKIHARAS